MFRIIVSPYAIMSSLDSNYVTSSITAYVRGRIQSQRAFNPRRNDGPSTRKHSRQHPAKLSTTWRIRETRTLMKYGLCFATVTTYKVRARRGPAIKTLANAGTDEVRVPKLFTLAAVASQRHGRTQLRFTAGEYCNSWRPKWPRDRVIRRGRQGVLAYTPMAMHIVCRRLFETAQELGDPLKATSRGLVLQALRTLEKFLVSFHYSEQSSVTRGVIKYLFFLPFAIPVRFQFKNCKKEFWWYSVT